MASKKVILNLNLQKGSFVNPKVASEGERWGRKVAERDQGRKNRMEKEMLAGENLLEISVYLFNYFGRISLSRSPHDYGKAVPIKCDTCSY